MQWIRFSDIAILRSPDSRVYGFHPYNLDMAELPESAWEIHSSSATNTSLIHELNEWLKELSLETTDALPEISNPVLSINVAQVCNLGCSYCAAGGDGTYGSDIKKLDLNLGEKIIAEFLAPYLKQNKSSQILIHFLGGEPLLYPEVVHQLCQYTQLLIAGSQLQISFSVTTNGTRFSKDTVAMLSKYNFDVTISIDGPAEIQDKNRPAKNKTSSSNSIENGLFELASVADKLSGLKVNSVFGSHNTDVLKTYIYLESLPITFNEYNFNFSNSDKDHSTNTQYIDSMQRLAQLLVDNNQLDQVLKISQFRRPLSKIFARTRHHNYCGTNHYLRHVDTRGDIYACNWDSGDKTERRTFDFLHKHNAEPTTLLTQNNCQSCWARHLCGGGCVVVHKNATGAKDQKDPQFCERTRALSAMAIVAYGEIINHENEITN
jgi:uncharacterized protein